MKAAEIRAELLENCDLRVVGEVAERLINQITIELNDETKPGRLNTASAMVARALICRGILQIGAVWLSEIRKGARPMPESYQALRGIMDYPPIELEGTISDAGG